ncbi:MAG TPA: glycoside hydrolase family 20 zincin-like fold domain-containing protein [Bryobacteraceae bacterium]
MQVLLRFGALCLSAHAVFAAVRVAPTPQYLEPLSSSVTMRRGGGCSIVLGPAAAAKDEKMLLAAEAIRRALQQADSTLHVTVGSGGGIRIYLWNYGADSKPTMTLNFLDRTIVEAGAHYGQSYVIRTPDSESLWVVGASPQGVLLGAMSVLQLIRDDAQGVTLPGVYIRDYPDYEFRAASDWLLNVEGNRWALDRGQGIESYVHTVEQKLDRALRYKINFVMFDGFGWGLDQRFAGYPEMMRRINKYARARGIHLEFGGYGASYGMAYQHGPLYEEGAYLGKVFENREHYPDGPVYRCMGFPRARKGVDPATLGSCRSNEELNKLKAEELRKYVAAVEPGALYIHHEDFGGFNGTQKVWLQRCQGCRTRWPNDSLAASNGGAGALANGYSALIKAVNSVKDPATGYDASRDCQIIVVSPVYIPDSPASESWANVLELWRNIAEELPRANNLQVCFRETFPQNYGGAKWTHEFNSVMRRAGVNLGIFMFFAGGADNYITDYPFAGTASMNAMFTGARTIYNFNGDFYQEPMEIVNAEYDWNVHSSGFFRDPRTFKEATDMRRRFMLEDEPKEMLAPEGLFRTACDLLYGAKAGPIMADYYLRYENIPDAPEAQARGNGGSSTYLPMTWNRAYTPPQHWRHLALDSKTWGKEISNEAYAAGVQNLKISREELHRRLAHRWSVVAEMNRKGAVLVDRALAAGPLPESVEDLRFLQTSFRVDQPLIASLAEFHSALRQHFAGQDGAQERAALESALARAKQARQLAAQAFPQPIDPIGAEVGSLRKSAQRLVQAIELWLGQ